MRGVLTVYLTPTEWKKFQADITKRWGDRSKPMWAAQWRAFQLESLEKLKNFRTIRREADGCQVVVLQRRWGLPRFERKTWG